jgi:hypothetical protein
MIRRCMSARSAAYQGIQRMSRNICTRESKHYGEDCQDRRPQEGHGHQQEHGLSEVLQTHPYRQARERPRTRHPRRSLYLLLSMRILRKALILFDCDMHNEEPERALCYAYLSFGNPADSGIGNACTHAPKLYKKFTVSPLTTMLCYGQTLPWKAGNPFL